MHVIPTENTFLFRIVSDSRYLLSMSQEFWEDFVSSPTFVKFPAITLKLVLEKISTLNPINFVSTRDVTFGTITLEFLSIKVPNHVPIVLRLPRPKHTPSKENQLAKSK